MNSDQIEAQVHNILFGIAALLTGFGVTFAGTSTATSVITTGSGIIAAILTMILSHKANTTAAVATSAAATVAAAQATVTASTTTPAK